MAGSGTQARRLERARADLVAGRRAGVRIADVAARWGSASQPPFARLFRARSGCSPSGFRAAVTGG